MWSRLRAFLVKRRVRGYDCRDTRGGLGKPDIEERVYCVALLKGFFHCHLLHVLNDVVTDFYGIACFFRSVDTSCEA